MFSHLFDFDCQSSEGGLNSLAVIIDSNINPTKALDGNISVKTGLNDIFTLKVAS